MALLENHVLGRTSYRSYTRPWPPAPWLREFPFIGLTLQLAASYEPALHKFDANMQAEPLGLVYKSDNVKYGIGIIDISDLDTVRYGIVAAGHTMIYIPRIFETDIPYDYVTDTRTRTPLSEQEYMAKFHYKPKQTFDIDAISRLEATPLLPPEALEGTFKDYTRCHEMKS